MVESSVIKNSRCDMIMTDDLSGFTQMYPSYLPCTVYYWRA